jgi:hypothetical protein
MAQSPAQRPVTVLIDLAFIAWCSYQSWRATSTYGRVFWGFLVALFLASLLGKLFARGAGAGPEEDAAKSIHAMQKGLYSGTHEYRHVDDSALQGLNVLFYEHATAALEQLGFRRMGQIVNLTAERVTPWARAVLRCFLSPDGTIMAAAYDVRMRSWYRGLQLIRVLPTDLRTIDLETELSDGRFVATSTATSAAKASDTPGVHRRFFSKDVPIADLVEHHRQHVQECLGGGDVRPVAHADFVAYRASQGRLQLLKSAHRNSRNYDPGEEIARVAGRPLNPQEQRLADQVRDLRESERRETP